MNIYTLNEVEMGILLDHLHEAAQGLVEIEVLTNGNYKGKAKYAKATLEAITAIEGAQDLLYRKVN